MEILHIMDINRMRNLHLHGFFDCPGEAIPFLVHYTEVFYDDWVASGVLVAIYRRGVL